jgi:flagellar basal body-associated protein FliL
MGKPEQPKDIKPKTEGEGEAKVKKPIDENMKVIIINLVTTVLICVLFLSVITIVISNMLDSKLAKVTAGAPAGDAAATDATGASEDDSADVQKGIIVDLGDFILNLSDVAPRKYLKVNVALEVSSKPEDTAPAEGAKKEGGEGKGPAVSPVDAEMAQFKPAFRDAVINTLSSKTSSELSTVAGKELAKDQITEAVNALFAGNREVLRVSFGDFIIQ